jgi:hypothetical protein
VNIHGWSQLTTYGSIVHEAARFFSRGLKKEKTTLIKLYQIAFILITLGLMSRTENAYENTILSDLRQLLVIEKNPTVDNPLTIEKLLNRPIDRQFHFNARMEEYQKYSKEIPMYKSDKCGVPGSCQQRRGSEAKRTEELVQDGPQQTE